MATKPESIRLQEETIRNMQRKKAPRKPKLKNPAGGVKRTPSAKTPQLTSQTKRPMNSLVINDRRNKLKKPKLSDKTIAPMSTKVIENRKNKLKKPKLSDKTVAPMSTKVIENRKNKLKKPKLLDKTVAPMSTTAIANRKNKLKKPKLSDKTAAPMSTTAIENRKNKLKKPKLKKSAKRVKGGPPKSKPQLKSKTKKPMNPLVINDRKNKLKKPKLSDKTVAPMSKEAINARKTKLKKPKLKNPAKGKKKTKPSKSPELKSGTKKPMSSAVVKARKTKVKKPKLDSKWKTKAKGKSSQVYPAVGFLFKVSVKGFRSDGKFKEVSGLSAEREVEMIVEGGNNSFAHKVPKGPTKYGNLVLKRGVISSSSQLMNWCLKGNIQSLISTSIHPKDISVQLLDAYSGEQKPLMTWSFTNAWPVKWEVSSFDAQKSEIVIESIEFAYQQFSVS